MSTESGIQYRVQSEVEPGLLAVRQAGGISALIGLAEATANTITHPGDHYAAFDIGWSDG